MKCFSPRPELKYQCSDSTPGPLTYIGLPCIQTKVCIQIPLHAPSQCIVLLLPGFRYTNVSCSCNTLTDSAEPEKTLSSAVSASLPTQKVLQEQVKLLYQSIGSLVLINLVVSTALVYGYWDFVPHASLLVWHGCVLAMLAARLAVYRSFRGAFDPEKLDRYKLFVIIGSASAGIIWGWAGLLMFVPGNMSYQLLILLALLAMTGGSAFSLSIYLPAFFAFVPITLLPIMVMFFVSGEGIHASLGAVTLVFLVALTLFNIKINRSLIEGLKLRYENLELIEQLKAQTREAERANRAKSKFLAAASHDIRQPLYALTLFTAALDETLESTESRRLLERIDASVKSLKDLLDTLLDISKLDAGVINAKKIDFPLADLLVPLANDFNPLAAQKGLEISWQSADYAVHSEPGLLGQILRNFLSNAIRYTESGSVRVTCNARDDAITIGITDTGPGIATGEQEVIFEEFHQLGNPERDRNRGLGLGLSIAQRAANLLDHKIAIHSRTGYGTTFSVTVDKAAQMPTAGVTQAEITVKPRLNDQLVVVIDDEESIRAGLENLLHLWGCTVLVGADDEDIIAQLGNKARQPDAIICDYRLRNHRNGLQAIAAIHRYCQCAVPAVIVTGEIAVEQLSELDNSGFQVLHKPVAPAKLRAFLRNLPT